MRYMSQVMGTGSDAEVFDMEHSSFSFSNSDWKP